MYHIYIIQNKLNNKIYIGQTNSIEYRWYCHKNNSFNENTSCYDTYIARAIRKYGIDAFNFGVIESYDNLDDCNEAEEFWIGYFSSYNNYMGYNIKLGGNNHIMSEETKQKIGASNKIALTGKILTEEHKNNISLSLKGKEFSQEHRDNLSKVLKGKQNCLGRVLSDETKNKISTSNLGNKNALGTKHGINSRINLSKSKLTLSVEAVENIINDFNNNHIKKKDLAIKYRVSKDTITRIFNGIYFNRVK